MNEVKLKRYAGPYAEPPFKEFMQSPIGLVPKDKGSKTCLIFYLSYPRSRHSVNLGIPKELCSMRYPDFSKAIELCLNAGMGCQVSKSDMSSAFRHVPLNCASFPYLVLKAEHPVTGRVYFFMDKCLPFGSSISCAIFQAFSYSVAVIVSHKTGKDLVNYLDDFLFAALMKCICDGQVQVFLQVCSMIRFPIALEKTSWGDTLIVFLGLLIDTIHQVVCIPHDKVQKALDWVMFFLNKRNKKATILQFQKLCGTLNFLCRFMIPGRVFLMRLYVSTTTRQGKVLKQHHHVKISNENRLDLLVWKHFLNYPEIFTRPF